MSKVSIIVPVYNGEKVLPRCVDSILTQDWHDIEVLLIDDGSRDSSWEIISSYAEKDPRVVAVHKENGGVSSTRNLGIEKATGEYIQFVDADDWLPFDSTKLLVREMESHDIQMVIGDFYRVVQDKASQKGSIREGGIISRNEYAENMLRSPADFYYGVLWNKLYRRDILMRENIRMDAGISFCEDMIFNLEYLLHVRQISVLKAPIYYYVLTEGSLVEQNLNLQSLVKMKTSVISYYDDFYRHILDDKDYASRRPIIYGYLLAVSTDALSIPLLNKTVRLNTEDGGRIYDCDDLKDTDMQLRYLSSALSRKLLLAVAGKHSMEINDVTVLFVLFQKQKDSTCAEISAVTGIDRASVWLSLMRLVAGGHAAISSVELLSDDRMSFRYVQGKLDDDLQQVGQDYENIICSGLSDEERKMFRDLRERTADNLKKTLQ